MPMPESGNEGTTPGPQTSGGGALVFNSALVAAVVGGIVAGLANAYVAFVNSTTLLAIETKKENEEQYIEEKKAEWLRLQEISKLDGEPAKQKLRAFIEMGLVTDARIRDSVAALDRTKPVGEASKTQSPISPATVVSRSSEWVGGGHNQDEMCQALMQTLAAEPAYHNKSIGKANASEDSRRDLFGHVTYQYYCNFAVSDPR